jgi:hypothetical protein
MRWIESITVHLLIAFLVWVIGAPLILSIIAGVVSPEVGYPEQHIWEIWGGICLILAGFLPTGIARTRLKFWLSRLETTGKESRWEKSMRKVLSWLDSPLLFPWQRTRLIPRVLTEIEPHLRSTGSTSIHQNLLKLLFSHSKAGLEVRDRLIMSFLTRGITSIDEANQVAHLWDEHHPHPRLGEIWADFALSHEIDAHWMDPGYLWAMSQGGERAERVTRFLLPGFLARNRQDDLATLVFLKAQVIAPSREVLKTLRRIAYDYARTFRNDPLARRVKEAIGETFEAEELVEVDDQIKPTLPLIKIRPAPKKSVKRERAPVFRPLWLLVIAFLQSIFHLFSNTLSKIKIRINLRYLTFSLGIAVLAIAAGLVIIRFMHAPKPEPAPTPTRSTMQVYQSDLRYTIQVSAYRDQTQAEQMVTKLRSLGEEAYWQKTDGQRPWYRVRVGGYATQGDAKRHAEDLIARKLISNYYVANFSVGYYRNP